MLAGPGVRGSMTLPMRSLPQCKCGVSVRCVLG